MLRLLHLATVFLAASVIATPTSDNSSPSQRCKEVSFVVHGSALNANYSSANLSAPLAGVINASYPLFNETATETLAGWFCLPSRVTPFNNRLQVFRGSFFTNRESWTALGGTALFNPPLAPYQPFNYSWFDFANNLGYPTLAIDTLGDGLSSRPDGLLVAQIPFQISLYHNLVQQIRAGTTGQLPQKYSTVYHIGNSLGSIFGNQMAANYPSDFDAMVLTGFTKSVDPSLPGVSLNNPAPAVAVNATRFAGVPPDYVTSTIEQSLTNSFFGDPKVVDFDPVVADLFFKRRDVVSLGDTIGTYAPGGIVTAPAYKGRIFVVTGENDQAFCGEGSSALSPNTMCGPLLAETKTLFPIADYNYISIPKTGHATILHKSSRYTFTVAHEFLAGASFNKA